MLPPLKKFLETATEASDAGYGFQFLKKCLNTDFQRKGEMPQIPIIDRADTRLHFGYLFAVQV